MDLTVLGDTRSRIFIFIFYFSQTHLHALLTYFSLSIRRKGGYIHRAYLRYRDMTGSSTVHTPPPPLTDRNGFYVLGISDTLCAGATGMGQSTILQTLAI